MPLYEYLCDACGRRFELIRKFSDPPLEACPTCGGTVRKLVSSPAFQFKGTGFYITDYAKKDQASAAQSEDAKSNAAEAKEKATGEKAEKSEKGEKGVKSDKSEKSDKGDRAEKPDTSEKGSKTDKGTAAAVSGPAAKGPAPSSKGRKDSAE
jgi:putative FmdB family regulatory protein